MTRTFSRFQDRPEAGERLAARLERRSIAAGVDVVFGVTPDGIPVARVVADALGVPLGPIVVRTITAPSNPNLTIGAVAADGSLRLDEALVERLGVDGAYVERTAEREAEDAREQRERYRSRAGDVRPEGDGWTALVVDDGAATGATATACVRRLRAAGAGRVVVAVPVASPAVVESLLEEADDVVAELTPADVGGVGRFYESFGPVPEERALALLDGDERGR
jgi:predicted phosphoribosyltransferase